MTMLTRCLAVYLLRYHGYPGSMSHGDATFFAYLGNVFVRSAPLPAASPDWLSGKRRDAKRPSGAILEAFGRAIADRAGAVCLLLANRIEAERTRRASEESAVRETLRMHPL